tara:strand:- start:3639 stop:3938 length:300 start_codon:yes stop_codon:yes gene_type:complete
MSEQSVTGAPTGNTFLDTLNGLLTIGGNALDKYSSFLSARETRRVEDAQNSTPPDIIVNVPTSNGNNFLSNPENLQKAFLYGGIGLVLTAGAYFILKKV